MTYSTESNNKLPVVGLVGVGVMGKCMLGRLKSAGYAVVAYDPFPGAQKFAAENGASVADSPAALASQARLILMSLPAGKQVLEAVTALSAGLTDRHIIVDTSTVDPETSREGARLAAQKGARYLDAPVLGRPSAAGNWVLPIGGPADAVEEAKPALLTFAKAAIRVGESGTGNTFKLLNQLMFSVINGVSSEVLALAQTLGVDRKVFFDVIAGSGAATVSGLFKETGSRIVTEKFDEPTFTVELLCKDAGLALQMAEKAGVSPRIAGLVQSINENAKATGLAKEDSSALYKIFLEQNAKTAKEKGYAK